MKGWVCSSYQDQQKSVTYPRKAAAREKELLKNNNNSSVKVVKSTAELMR